MSLPSPSTAKATSPSAVGTTRPCASRSSTVTWATSRRSAAISARSPVRRMADGSPVVETSTVVTALPSFVPTAFSVPGSYGTSHSRHHLAATSRAGVGICISTRTQPTRRQSLADHAPGGVSRRAQRFSHPAELGSHVWAGGGRRTGTGPPGSGAAADGGHRAGGRQLRHFRVCLRRAPNPAPAAVAADRRARPEGAGRRQAALRQTPEGSLGSQRLGTQNAPGPARRSAGGGLGGSLPAPRAPRGDLVFLHHPGPEAQAHPGALQTALEHRNRSAKFEAHGGSASAHQ